MPNSSWLVETPGPVSWEPRKAADDDVTDTEQPTDAAGGDAGRNNVSAEEIENLSTSQFEQESDRQGTETEDVIRSRRGSTLASDFLSGKSYLDAVEPRPGSDVTARTKRQGKPAL